MTNETMASGASARARDVAGRYLPTHGAVTLEKALRRGKLPRRYRRLLARLHFEYALHTGSPSWVSTPAPVRDAIDNVIRQRLLAERYFDPFFRGEDVSKRFDTVSENLRRQLRDLGLQPQAPAVDAGAILAGLRASDPRKASQPRAGSSHGDAT